MLNATLLRSPTPVVMVQCGAVHLATGVLQKKVRSIVEDLASDK